MTKKFSTGISPEYVKNWDTTKAVREIIQNYLDVRDEFGVGGRITWNNGIAYVRDLGAGIEPRHLAMGISEKSEDSIGKYGEGLKLALLVMAREKRNIELRARGQVIKPTIEWDENYQTDIMMLTVDEDPTIVNGTTIRFECSEEELEAGKLYFERFLKSSGTLEWIEQGKLSLPGGYVYVNGARVGKLPTESLFSYHLNEKEVGDIGNRDREVINQNKIGKFLEGMMWNTSSRQAMEMIMKAMKDGTTNLYEIAYSGSTFYWQMDDNRKPIWKRAYNAVFGEGTLVFDGNHEALTQAEYIGHKVMDAPTYSWRSFLQNIGVDTCTSILKKAGGTYEKVNPKDLTTEELANYVRAKDLVETNYMSVGKVIIAKDLTLLSGASSGTVVRGLYSRKDDTIFLAREVLEDITGTLHTLLHEAVHKHSGESDCTAEFETALTNVAVNMMLGM